MILSQFPPNEIGEIVFRALQYFKKRKFTGICLYIFFLFYFSIPSFQIPVLEYGSFRVTSLMEERALENYLLFYPQQAWVNISEINPVLLKAVISMEDGKFFYHKGIDWKELDRSMRANQRRGRTVRGASTITMQTAKNLFLSTDKNFFRKAKELLIACRMEKEISKRAILENYINAVEWGDGIFGIKEASLTFFKKEPRNLNYYESARLAAVIPSPLRHTPNSNSNYVLRRSSIIRGRINDIILFPKKKR